MSERKGILVVDDSLAALKLLTDILMAEGYAVRPATSGEQAMASVRAETPELILLDVRMPAMDGFETCARIRELEACGDIPILFLSASADNEERVKGFEKGAVDFISKPFQRNELLARVRTHLELSRLRGRLESMVATRTDELRISNEKLQLELAERKKAEEMLKRSLDEKEVLIRELYHRTKNNMQVICSMLKLNSHYNGDEKSGAVLRDMENRIYTMALVHQKLFQSKNLSCIYFHDFIAELCELLLKSYRVPDGKISLKLDIEEIPVLIDIAVPCGLALDELITNSLKYAFPGGREGEISIKISRSVNGEICITYADNGKGFPAGFDFEKDGRMGIQTICSVGRHQLQGKVDFISGPGVECRIVFHEKQYSQRV